MPTVHAKYFQYFSFFIATGTLAWYIASILIANMAPSEDIEAPTTSTKPSQMTMNDKPASKNVKKPEASEKAENSDSKNAFNTGEPQKLSGPELKKQKQAE